MKTVDFSKNIAGHFFTIYFPGLYVLCFTRPIYQVSFNRTIGPLVFNMFQYVCADSYRPSQ